MMEVELLFLVLVLITVSYSFNIDTSVPILKQSKNPGKSYFGYSVFPHKLLAKNAFRVLVGAPLDNMTNYVLAQRPSGAVFSCPLTSTSDDCRPLLMLKLNPRPGVKHLYQHQWLGVHVRSDTVTKGGQYAYTCAHRFSTFNVFTGYVVSPGQCLLMPNSLHSSGFNSLVPLSPSDCPVTTRRPESMCLRGMGFASRPDLGVVAIGAANEKRGRGVVHFARVRPSPDRAKWNHTKVLAGDTLQNSYVGYSVGLGRIYGDHLVNFTLAAGAPGIPDDRSLVGADWSREARGQVRLFAVSPRTPLPEARTVLRGERFGSRFGQELLVADFNGDGWDDLIVGAPEFEDSEGEEEESGKVVGCGAVYVYLNEEGSGPQQRRLRRVATLRPRTLTRAECLQTDCANARFGAAVAKVGDLNMDGLEDIGIGAPGEGGGVVYIYHGHRVTGLTERPTQILVASKINKQLRGFGTSLAGGLDLDGNLYPDIVIGAPLSGHAVVLRTRPVIDVLCSVVFEPAELDPALGAASGLVECGKSGLCLSAKVYLSYRHAGSVLNGDDTKFSYKTSFSGRVTLTLDDPPSGGASSASPGEARIVFESGETRRLSRAIRLRHSRVMDKKAAFAVRLYLDPRRFIDKMSPVALRVAWQLHLRPPVAAGVPGSPLPDLNHFPVYDAAAAAKTFRLPWRRGCEQPVCVSDLALRMATDLERSLGRFIFYFGREDDFWLNFTVSNKKEAAHKTILSLEFTNRLVLLSTACPYRCTVKDWRLQCPIANPLPKDGRAQCSIHLSGLNIVPDTPRLDFIASLITVSDNVDGGRLNISFSASVQILANVRMTGIVEPEMVIFGEHRMLGASSVIHEKKIGPRVTYTLLLENSAKSGVIPASDLTIYWPYEVVGEHLERHGKYLMYMIEPPLLEAATNNSLQCNSRAWSDLVNPNKVRLLSRGYYRDSSPGNVFSYSTGVADVQRYELCSNGLARCRPIRCRLGHLSRKSGPIRIRINARLWVHTMTEDFPDSRFVPILVNVTWRPAERYTVAQLHGNDTSLLMRLVASNTLPQPARRPDNMWMLVGLSILGGVMVLGCLILFLWKLQFFRRDTRVQEQRLAQQQQLAAAEEELHKYDYMEYD